MILALNCGSSSLKYALFGAHEAPLLRGEVRGIGVEPSVPTHAHAVEEVFQALGPGRAAELSAIVHRIVHGGPVMHEPTLLTPEVRAELRSLSHFAPLHLPSALAAVDAALQAAPGAVQVAVFDTDFHWTVVPHARRLPLPRAFDDLGVRKYGFHGLSCASVIEQLGRALGPRALIAHLGSGASVTALRDGVSVDTTMSFTPAGGIPCATRSGDLDPGVMLHLLRRGLCVDSLEELVWHKSGILGVSETTSDMQRLLAERATDSRARLAVELFVYAVRKAIGGLTAALGGLDTLVFTGGIGERASEVRAEICAGLAHLGVALEPRANEEGWRVLSASGAPVEVLIVQTDEERVMAGAARKLTDQPAHHAPLRAGAPTVDPGLPV